MAVIIRVMRSASASAQGLRVIPNNSLLVSRPRVTVRGCFQLPPLCYQYYWISF